MTQPSIDVDLASINANANLLVEIAGALAAGRPDQELSRRASAPVTPDDLSGRIREFADAASDQHQSLVALLAVLSTKLADSAGAYGAADQAIADALLRPTGST